MISIDNLTKRYGSQTLFENISVNIGRRERVGLVGRNGQGKTTLLRLIAGEEQPDTGTISIPKGYRIGYVQQHIDFDRDTVIAEAMKGLREEERDQRWKVERILAGLGFSPQDMLRHPHSFSGGYQVRLNLAKVLVGEPDLLLLDEPTNYLDITSIRWIERLLCAWPRELILITHDRSFMDNIVTQVLGIHRCRVRKIAGTTEKYYAQIAQEEEVYEKTRRNDERRRKEIEVFISRFRAKARLANLVQSRVKLLEKMGSRPKLEAIKTLDFSFRYQACSAKYLMSVHNLSFGYEPDRTLFSDLSFSIGSRDRIGVIGNNGKGKTTLLKVLAGALQPQQGQIKRHPNAVIGFFEQTTTVCFDPLRTVEEEILYSHPDVDLQMARSVAGAMLFEGDAALKKIGVLSGGEKSRVALAKLLVTPLNLLLLDEPTNHLDMASSDALLAALDNFDGAVVLVTHNEMLLHALAERLIVFQGTQPQVFEGRYQHFLERCGWHEENERRGGAAPSEPELCHSTLTKKEIRRIRSHFFVERSRVLKPLEDRIAQLEQNISAREQELADSTAAMQEATQARDASRIATIAQTIHACQSAIEHLFEELEQAIAAHEEQQSVFQKKHEEIERLGQP